MGSARARRLAAAVFACMAVQAAPHRFRVFPNTSITVLAIAEGSDGFLWLAAEDGAYRFDGFHFHKVPGFPFSTVHLAATTRDGSVWLGGSEGLVRYRAGTFQVLQREGVNALAAAPDYVFVKNGGIHRRFGLDGSVTVLHRSSHEQITLDPSGLIWFSSTAAARAVLVDPAAPDVPVRSAILPEPFEQVATDRFGNLWAAHDGTAVEIGGKAVRHIERRQSRRTARPFPLMAGRNGHLWFVGETIERLGDGLAFQDGPSAPQSQPTSAYEDSSGNLWAAILGVGLVEWIVDPAWQRWKSEDPVSEITESPDGTIVAATRGNLYRLDRAKDAWAPVSKVRRDYAAVAAFPGFGWLASIHRQGVGRIAPAGALEAFPEPAPSPDPDKYRIIRRDGQGAFWVGNKARLYRIEGRPGAFRLAAESLPDVPAGRLDQPVDLDVDESGNLWTGYTEGLAWRDRSGHWTNIATDRPVRDVRSFALGPNRSTDEIWVAYRSGGRFSKLSRAGAVWRVTDFTPAGGFGPADTHFIKRDSRGWIWRGAPDGVHVMDGVHASANDWIRLSPANGLSAESLGQYGFFEQPDGSVWLSGEEGMSRLKPDAAWFRVASGARAPKIIAIEIDGHEPPSTNSGEVELPSHSRSVHIELGSLDAPAFYDAPFKYRLHPLDGGWKLSNDGTLEFRDLANGSYTLDIAYAPDGGPSPSVVRFRIGSPPLNVAWFIVPPVAAGAGAVALFGPWFWWSQRNRYKLAKWLFLLRRRFESKAVVVERSTTRDYSGQTFLSRYLLVRPVSHGGFSVVYDARDLSRNARVAVKVLCAPEGAERWLSVRFAHEIAALRTVRHPAVVEVLDSWIAPEGEPCLAMPFLEGPTLRQALRDGPLHAREAARLIVRLADALAEMHLRGIVHRDLKPENVMFTDASRAEPVIIDYGAASLRTRADRTNTTTLMAGSVRYMAPERLAGRFSPATDVFGLALIAIESLTGRTPADFTAPLGDARFEPELESVLCRSSVPNAASAARALAQACSPQPQLRPADIRAWAKDVSDALCDRV